MGGSVSNRSKQLQVPGSYFVGGAIPFTIHYSHFTNYYMIVAQCSTLPFHAYSWKLSGVLERPTEALVSGNSAMDNYPLMFYRWPCSMTMLGRYARSRCHCDDHQVIPLSRKYFPCMLVL